MYIVALHLQSALAAQSSGLLLAAGVQGRIAARWLAGGLGAGV